MMDIKKMKTFSQFKKELFKDKELKAAYDALEPDFQITVALIKYKLEKGLTQKQLVKEVNRKMRGYL